MNINDHAVLLSAAKASRELLRRQDAALADKALYDLGAFCRLMWAEIEPARTLRWSWHHEVFAREVQAHYEGRTPGPLVACGPPRTGKSTILSVLGPAFFWLRRPEAAILAMTVLGANRDRDARAMLTVVSSPAYARLRSRGVELGACIPWRVVGDGAQLFRTSRGGSRLSRTIGGAITGAGADLAIIDDPIDAAEVVGAPERASRLMAEAWEWLDLVFTPRLNPGARLQLTMQRLHEGDPAGRMIEAGARAVVLPLLFEPAHPHRYAADPRAPGEVLDEALAGEVAKRSANVQRFAAQEQLRPAPREGALFQRADMRRFRAGEVAFEWSLISVDAALKASGASEFAISVFGVSGPNVYWRDLDAGHWTYPQLVDRMRAMIRRYPDAQVRLVEDAAAGAPMLDDLGRSIPGMIRIQPVGSKYARALVAAGWAEAGNLYLPESAPWLDHAETQVFTFPNSVLSDVVDTLSQAVGYVARTVGTLGPDLGDEAADRPAPEPEPRWPWG